MIIISHRGNTNGPTPHENQIHSINQSLALGFDVEIDVWFTNGLFLGHDKPETPIEISFLNNDHLWCHAKNMAALELMLEHGIHCFYHQTDDATLTSRGFIWVYPGKELFAKSICVMPELTNTIPQGCYGVCTDYPIRYSTNPQASIA